MKHNCMHLSVAMIE